MVGVWLPSWQGSLKTVAHATLSPCGLYLCLYRYRCGCTYCVALKSVQLMSTTTESSNVGSKAKGLSCQGSHVRMTFSATVLFSVIEQTPVTEIPGRGGCSCEKLAGNVSLVCITVCTSVRKRLHMACYLLTQHWVNWRVLAEEC